MANVKSNGENHKIISKSSEKVAKWLDSLPIFYETESVVQENEVMIEPKSAIVNNVTTSTDDNKTVENAKSTINDDVNELLKVFDDNECYGMDVRQSDDENKYQNKLPLNDNEVSTDHPSVYVEGSVYNNLFYYCYHYYYYKDSGFNAFIFFFFEFLRKTIRRVVCESGECGKTAYISPHRAHHTDGGTA